MAEICPEAAELLKERQFSTELSLALRRMKPTRQVECAELMISANNVTVAYVRALLATTSPEMLVGGKKLGRTKGISQDQMARMEREMSNLQGQYKMAEQTYGEDMLNLVLARGYIVKLLGNKQVSRYLELHQAEVLDQFVSIVQTTSMDL